MLGRGEAGVVLDNGDETVSKIILLTDERDKLKFTNEVYALIKFSEYDVCPKIYSSRITNDDNFQKYFSYYKNTYNFGIIIMEKMDGTLKEYKEKYGENKSIHSQLKEKYEIMLKHGFIYCDIHEENILYKKNEDIVNWYFVDMDIYTFEEYKQNVKERNENILKKQKENNYVYKNLKIIPPDEALQKTIKSGFSIIESL